jgi:VWFA-related protein
MNKRFLTFLSILLILLAAGRASVIAQQTAAPSPTPGDEAARAEQEPVRIYTQEVKLPVVAYDNRERFDPTLAPDDVLVLEEGVPQRVRSARRLPANVLLVFDTAAQVTATHSNSLARDAALRLLSTLREGDQVAVIQNGASVGVLQDWTSDADAVAAVLKSKLLSGKRSRLSECLSLAASKVRERADGSAHVVVFTDGLESQSREKIQAAAINPEAARRLAASQASVHIFCFASLVKEFVKQRNSRVSVGGDGRTVKVVIDVDEEMRRWFREYARASEQRKEQLAALAREAGGRLLLPATAAEAAEMADQLWRDIGAQYVVTYAPKLPLSPGGAARRVEVSSRRLGLRLFSLRTSIVAPAE